MRLVREEAGALAPVLVVACECGAELRVRATTWRVTCPCGCTAVLEELRRDRERAVDVKDWP